MSVNRSRYFDDAELACAPLADSAVILQARMGATRLPGKMMLDLCGKPLLERVVERLAPLLGRDRVYLATTDLPGDDGLAEYAERIGVPVFRGDSEDVLARYIGAAQAFGVTGHIVRATGDDPLTAVDELAAALREHIARGADYTRLLHLPVGAQEEIVAYPALLRSLDAPLEDYHRQHVVEYLLEHPEAFNVHFHESEERRRRETLRFTVDEMPDLEVVRRIIEALGPAADLDGIIAFLDAHPEVTAINAGVCKKALGTI
ncbi:cytidylyltransferase domain-containing protein [Endothiovibrio diazotrophicus]